METITKYWGQKTKAEKYLEFVNDWITIEAISDNYGLKIEGMQQLLNEGKIEHLENCVTTAKNKVEVLREALTKLMDEVNDMKRAKNILTYSHAELNAQAAIKESTIYPTTK